MSHSNDDITLLAALQVRFIFSLRNPVARAYSEYLNKVDDKTVVRYLNKRIDNKMEKVVSHHSFSRYYYHCQLIGNAAEKMPLLKYKV